MEEFFIALENHPLTATIVFWAIVVIIAAFGDVVKEFKNKN